MALYLVGENIDKSRSHSQAATGKSVQLMRGMYVDADDDMDAIVLRHAVRIALGSADRTRIPTACCVSTYRREATCRSTRRRGSMPLSCRSTRALEPALDSNRRWSFILSASHYCNLRPILFINPVLRLALEIFLYKKRVTYRSMQPPDSLQ